MGNPGGYSVDKGAVPAKESFGALLGGLILLVAPLGMVTWLAADWPISHVVLWILGIYGSLMIVVALSTVREVGWVFPGIATIVGLSSVVAGFVVYRGSFDAGVPSWIAKDIGFLALSAVVLFGAVAAWAQESRVRPHTKVGKAVVVVLTLLILGAISHEFGYGDPKTPSDCAETYAHDAARYASCITGMSNH